MLKSMRERIQVGTARLTQGYWNKGRMISVSALLYNGTFKYEYQWL